jgi:hypothetical protein
MSTTEEILKNIDFISILATLIIAIIGWIIAIIIQNKSIKKQQQNQIKYDVYKQFVSLHKEIQDTLGKLSAESNPPFIQMDSCMIPFELGLKKEYKGTFIPYTEQECRFSGEKKWTSYTQNLFDRYFSLTNKIIQLGYITEDWYAMVYPLIKSKETLFEKLNKKTETIRNKISELQSFPHEEHDWSKWDREKGKEISNEIMEVSITAGSFLEDFMVLLHNELLAPYFKNKNRPTRKTFDPKFKVLTKEGVIENFDKEMFEKIKKYQKYFNEDTQKCPECDFNNPEVINVLEDNGKVIIQLSCGHDYEFKNKNQKTT